MKIDNKSLGRFALTTNDENVSITIKEGEDKITGECLILELQDMYIRIGKLIGTKFYKIFVYPNKKEYLKAKKEYKKFLKWEGSKELRESVKRADKNWKKWEF